jgi:hypothetical protein
MIDTMDAKLSRSIRLELEGLGCLRSKADIWNAQLAPGIDRNRPVEDRFCRDGDDNMPS